MNLVIMLLFVFIAFLIGFIIGDLFGAHYKQVLGILTVARHSSDGHLDLLLQINSDTNLDALENNSTVSFVVSKKHLSD